MPFRPPLTGPGLGRSGAFTPQSWSFRLDGRPSTTPRTVPSSPITIGSRPGPCEDMEWAGGRLRPPLHVVDNGRNLPDDLKALTNHSVFRSYMDNLVSLQGTLRGIH